MVSGFIGQFTGLLVHPRSTLASLKQVPLRSAFTYFLAVWAVFAVLFCLVGWRLNFNSRPLDPWLLVQFAILVLAFWLFFGLVVHAVLRILSGPKSIEKTYRAVLYAATPIAAMGWVSLIMGLSFIWGLFLMERGIVEYHEIPRSTAFFILLLSIVIAIMTFAMAYYLLLVAGTLVVH